MSQNILDQVIAIEQRWTQAHLDNDIAVIESIMDDEYQKIDNSGRLLNKAETLATYTPETRLWELAESDEHTVQLHGNLALLTDRWRARGINNGVRFDYSARFISIYILRDADLSNWKMIFEQSTEFSP
ncbi:nuclear transport factor 2 family protein [Gemmatimonas aurantiaca]|nr:nuclear transport factor 2 family protein [Gemmatimonas aurantiaca]